MKKETIEEAAERLYPNDGQFEEFYGNINEFSQKVFLQGAKWQQERMYSEEEVEKIVRKAYTFGEKEFKYFGAFKEWFEKFKKK